MSLIICYGIDDSVLVGAALPPSPFLCKVISQYKGQYKIAMESEECFAEVFDKLRYEAIDPSRFSAVGDFVMADRAEGSTGDAMIHRVLSRKSVLERTVAVNEHQSQIIAANIDIVLICMSLSNNYNLNRLECYLSVTWSSGATPVAVLTRANPCENLPDVLSEIMKIAPGTDVVTTSRSDLDFFEKLLSCLRLNRTVIFVGSSDVGKTTLTNYLAGENLLVTPQTRSGDRDRHTTTRREMILLLQGGIVISTPGLRELDMESADLPRSFAEVDTLAEHCRFRDCTHASEPDRTILKALEIGKLTLRRLENYRKLRREAGYDGLSSRQIGIQELNAVFEAVGGTKNGRKFIRQNDKRKGGF